MLKHNILLFFRNIKRHKTTFLINIIGLSTGLAGVLLIYLWATDEMNVDKFHKKDSQLYQVLNNQDFPDGIQTGFTTPALLAGALVEDFPEIETAVAVGNRAMRPVGILSYGNLHLETEGLYASSNYFDVFSYELIEGDPRQIVIDKNQIVLSEAIAMKLFNKTDNVVGKTIEWKTNRFNESFQVSGVYANPPANGTQQFDAVIHFDWLIDGDEDVAAWSESYAETCLVLRKDTDLAHFNDKIANYLRPKNKWWGSSTLFVKQYSKKYLYGNYEDGLLVGGRIAYIRLFSIIALFILLIASINFMNLSTARASTKMKEIGVKKVIGAQRKVLIVQFLGESVLMAILSAIVAVILVILLLPQFNAITGKQLQLNYDPNALVHLVGIVLCTGLLAGSYPAFYLSGFKPITVLKGKMNNAIGEQWIRKGLVVFQFVLSVIFIVGVLVINQQMRYTQTKNLGYNRDNIISFQRNGNLNNTEVFLSELKSIPGVLNASIMAGSNFISGSSSQSGYSWRGLVSDEDILFKAPQIGYDAIETLEMKVIDGRSFSRKFRDDRTKIIVNETALDMMQLEDPVGKIISKYVGNGREERQIIGVIKDFHYGSIHQKIEPLILRFRPEGREILAKIKTSAERTSIEQIKQLYKKFHPNYPFYFSFLDKDYQALYEAESKVAVLSKYFSGLAIIISCLGLLGLASFIVVRRRKEISIRKVLGQSTSQITMMLSGEFAKLVLLSIGIALPIAYVLTSDWLSGFAYRIPLKFWYFVGAGLVALLVALLTVGSQAIRAANKNPVNALREE